MRTRHILAVTGLSGSGKSTLIETAKSGFVFKHLSASELIKDFRKNANITASSEELRTGDLPQNQADLVHAFRHEKCRSDCDIVFDCHTLIDTPNSLVRISSDVFTAIGVSHFAFLWVDPVTLVERRERDTARERPNRNQHELDDQQKIAIGVALDIAEANSMPFTKLAAAPSTELERLLTQLRFKPRKNP